MKENLKAQISSRQIAEFKSPLDIDCMFQDVRKDQGCKQRLLKMRVNCIHGRVFVSYAACIIQPERVKNNQIFG